MQSINYKLIIIIFISIIFSLQTNAQEWIVYNQKNSGLINNSINTITIDKQGNKFFGTRKGISKFDGINWINYTVANTDSGIANDFIYCIVTDSSDNKWVGYASEDIYGTALSKFDGKKWTKYKKSYTIFNSMAIDDKERLWYGTIIGLFVFDGVNWKTYDTSNCPLRNNQILGIASDKIGNIWIGSFKSGVLKFDGNNWIGYTPSNSGLAGDNVFCIKTDKQGNVWFGTNNGISKFNGVTWITYNSTNSELVGKIADLAFDLKGNLWIATTKGVFKFDGTHWHTYNTSNSGLSSNVIYCVEVDQQGNKWFGTEKNGISFLKDQ